MRFFSTCMLEKHQKINIIFFADLIVLELSLVAVRARMFPHHRLVWSQDRNNSFTFHHVHQWL